MLEFISISMNRPIQFFFDLVHHAKSLNLVVFRKPIDSEGLDSTITNGLGPEFDSKIATNISRIDVMTYIYVTMLLILCLVMINFTWLRLKRFS